MPYIEETVIAGKTKEVYKYYSTRYGKKNVQRGVNKNKTPDDMRRVNERMAEKKLRLLLNENFKYKDIHLVLTYRRGERPTQEQGRADLEKFMRNLRKYFKDRRRELKYVTGTEYLNSAIHHHLVISSMDTRDLPDMWPHGQPRPTYLDNSGDYSQLARYFIKETRKTFKAKGSVYGKRWCASKNLKQPKVKKRIVNRDGWRETPKPTAGYRLETNSIETGVNEVTGFEYQFYRMIKINDKKGRDI